MGTPELWRARLRRTPGLIDHGADRSLREQFSPVLRTIMRALTETDATVLIGVPRLYRALYDGIRDQIRGVPYFARSSRGDAPNPAVDVVKASPEKCVESAAWKWPRGFR